MSPCFRTDQILVTVCWFWCSFVLVKWLKFWVSRHFLENTEKNGMKSDMLMYPDHWLDFDRGLLIFIIFVISASWLGTCQTGLYLSQWWLVSIYVLLSLNDSIPFPLGKMGAKLQEVTFSASSSMKIGYFLYFSLKSVPWVVIDEKSSLV